MELVVENNFLNDDCVLEILQYVSIKTLIRVSKVSLQFNRLAQIIFRKKFRTFAYHRQKGLDQREVELMLNEFGHLLENLSLKPVIQHWYTTGLQNKIIKSIEKNCSTTENHLKTLELHDFYANDAFYLLQNAFLWLEKVEITFCAIPYSILQLINKLPRVKELKLVEPLLLLSATTISQNNVIKLNPNLEKLYMECYSFKLYDFIPVIDISYPNISELTLRMELSVFAAFKSDNLMRIANLKKLKKLDLDIEILDISKLLMKFVENGIDLTHLYIRRVRHLRESIIYLCKLNNIEELFLAYSFNMTVHNIHTIANSLKQLKLLSVMNIEVTSLDVINIINVAEKLRRAEFILTPNGAFDSYSCIQMKNRIKTHNLGEKFELMIHKGGFHSMFTGDLTEMRSEEFCKYLSISRHYNAFYSVLFGHL